MTTMAYGYTVHNFLNHKDEISLTNIEGGYSHFEAEAIALIDTGDHIIKWSEDGEHKTLWCVVSVSPIGYRGRKRIYSGRLVDCFSTGEKINEFLRNAIGVAQQID